MSPCRTKSRCSSAFLFALLIISFFPSTPFAFFTDTPYPKILSNDMNIPSIASISTSWTYTLGDLSAIRNSGGGSLKPILLSLRETGGPGFVCGFYCPYDHSNSCFFAILIFQEVYSPQLVWSANGNHPVGLDASLQLTEDGNLVLAEADGTFVWSTDTADKSVSALNLTGNGNLVLIDRNKEIVWQSFDHPTDSLVLQQKLVPGKKLISSVSSSNLSQGLFSLFFTTDGIAAHILSNPPQQYYEIQFSQGEVIKYTNGSLSINYGWGGSEEFNLSLFDPIPIALSAQYMRLEFDGHLRVYQWQEDTWQEAVDLLSRDITECQYPLACGKYGICSAGQCTCPSTTRKTSYIAAYF